MAAIPRPTHWPVVKPRVDEDELELGVEVATGPVRVGFAPAAVGVTPPAPVLTAFPVPAAVPVKVATPPKGVTELPPYWLTFEGN
jgi:hypothetical protein